MRTTTTLCVAFTILLFASSPQGYVVPRRLADVVAEREAGAASPSSVLLVHEIAALWDHEDPEAVLAAVGAAASDARTPRWASSYARWVEGRLLRSLGRMEQARAVMGELGFVQRWVIVGPFDNDNESGFDTAYPPEQSLGRPLDLDGAWEGKLREVGWREYPSPAAPDGAVEIGAVLDPAERACAYLATAIDARRAGRAALRLGADGAVRVWLNGRQVYSDAGDRAAMPDRAAAGVQLQRGRNQLVVKSCMTDGPWNLFLRLTQPDGRPLEGVTATAERAALLATPPRGAAPFEVPSLWSYFWDRVGGEPGEAEAGAPEGEGAEASPPARAQAELARFLTLFGGDDPSEHRARDAAEAAVAADPSVDNLRLLAGLHPDRNRRLDALRRALALEPRRADVLMALAGEIAAGPHPEDALAYVDRAAQTDPGGVATTLARADLLASFEMPLTAIAQVRPLLGRAPRAAVAGTIQTLAASAGLSELEEEMARRYFETHRGSTVMARDLARLHAGRGERDRALELLRAGLEHAPLSILLRAELATVLEAAGEVEPSLEQRRASIAIRPHDGALHEGLALALDRQGRDEEAQAAARRSLDLRPENPALTQWLSVVAREERFEGPYVEAPETFLARRGQGSGYDVRSLLDLEVRKVNQSGQSEEFRQHVFEAVTLQGARNLASYEVAYAPHRQRLRIERARVYRPDGSTLEAHIGRPRDLYDASVRMYYDLQSREIAFGDLQAGDVVEITYRLSDVGSANELGNYFGELNTLQGGIPRAREVYVLLVPAGRQLVFNDPHMASLAHRVRELGQVVEHVFEATDVPAIRLETGMPPLPEVVPLLHVSTFTSWEELGRWYWSLARDQLELDAGQRARVAELVRGARDDLAKVRAIHQHVVRNVRYVALEFGVHRFKPYRVTDIERRGFGDCKDQASLMVAMLGHAGVQADLVLVRTRRLGRIPTDPPSLEVFNHAIVYVPSLDMYIDPTADRVSVGALPSDDQGVTALRVSERGVLLTTIPMMAPDRQTRRVDLSVQLAAGGDATGRLEMVTTGWLAGVSRATLDDPAGRVSYLERLLGSYMRGVRVSNVTTSDLRELDDDTEATMDLEVPGFARREGADLSFPMSIAPPLSGVVSLPRRDQDLIFGPPVGWIESVDVQVPAGMTVAPLPAPVEIDTPMATFRATASRTTAGGRDTVQLRSTLLWRAERVTPGDYGALRELVERVMAARTARVRLVAR